MKTFHNSPKSPATKNVPDIKKFGSPGAWKLIAKASSDKEHWMKSTKIMNLPNGCLFQVTTQHENQVAEALQFVPDINVKLTETGLAYRTVCLSIPMPPEIGEE